MRLFKHRHNVTTTVGDLIEKLKEFDPDLFVYTEGCDCIGNVVDVTLEDDGAVVICRDDDLALP